MTNYILAIIVLVFTNIGLFAAVCFLRHTNSGEIDELKKLASNKENENPVEPLFIDQRLSFISDRFIRLFLENKQLRNDLNHKKSQWKKVKDEKPEGDVIFKTPWGDVFRGRIDDDGDGSEGIWIFDGFEVENTGSSYAFHPEFKDEIPEFEYLPLKN